VHLYDLRSGHDVKVYTKPSIFFGATSVDFTRGGQIMFVGYEDYTLRAWDVLRVSESTDRWSPFRLMVGGRRKWS